MYFCINCMGKITISAKNMAIQSLIATKILSLQRMPFHPHKEHFTPTLYAVSL